MYHSYNEKKKIKSRKCLNRTCVRAMIDIGKPKRGGLPSKFFGGIFPPDERKEGMSMGNVTYTDMFQFCMFVIGLVGLCYQIFKDKK